MAIKKTIIIDADTSNAQKNIEAVGESVEDTAAKTKGSLDGVIDQLDTFSGGMITKFKSFTSTLSGVTTGFKSMGVAIAATGIGLLVIGIAAVTAAFKSSEAGQNKFAKYLGIIGSVVGNLLDVLSDLGEGIIEVFENPKESFETFKKLLKENITNRLEGLLELFPKLGTAIKQLFSGDFSGAAATAANAVAKVALGTDNLTDSIKNAGDALKAFGEEVAEDAKKAEAIAAKRAKADKVERNLLIARAKADREIAEFKQKSTDKENYSLEERIKFLVAAAEVNEKISSSERYARGLRLSALKAENTLSKSNKEALNEEAQLTADLIDIDTARLERKQELQDQVIALREEDAAAKKAEIDEALALDAEALEKAKEAELKRLEGIKAIQDEFNTKVEDEKAVTEEQKLELDKLRQLRELDALKANEEEKANVIAYYDDKIQKAKEDKAKQELKNDKILQKQKISVVANTFGAIAGLLGEASAAGKAFASGQALINTYLGVTEVLSNKTTLPEPFGTINKIASTISVLASGLSAVKQINSTDNSPTGGTSSATPLATASTPPSFNVIGTSPESQIAQGLNKDSDTPIKAYVLTKDVTTSQEYDRNVASSASIG